MNRNNSSQFNPRCYEEQLSPFGKKVLNTLIKKWNRGDPYTYINTRATAIVVIKQRNYNKYCRPYYLTPAPAQPIRAPLLQTQPLQSHTSLLKTPPLPRHTPLLQPPFALLKSSSTNEKSSPLGNYVINETPFDFLRESDCSRNAPSCAPTSAELIKTVHCLQEKLPDICSDNLVQTVLAKDNESNFNTDDIHTAADDNEKDLFIFRPNLATDNYDDDHTEVNFNDVRGKEIESSLQTRNIDWDDMFDTELFSKVMCTETKKEIQVETASNLFKIDIPNSESNKTCEPKAADSKTKNRKNTAEPAETKKAKRKNVSKITDSIPKKIKKPSIEISKKLKEKKFRKQKYTVTVNNWLEDVDPQHMVEEDKIYPVNMEMSPKPKNRELVDSCKNDTSETHRDENNLNEKSSKKIVQAQLANKDGVMKFAKPKKVKSKSDESITNGKKEKNESVKDKKTKSKFTAPIKSQIPVQDVSYEIITINEENVEKHLRNIVNNAKREILMIAVYSNGFCQLNQQHTEDACTAEGILTCVGDQFFYFKLNTFKDFMPHLLNNNNIISFDGKTLLLLLLSLNIDVSSVEVIDAKIGGALLAPDNAPENFADLQKILKFTPQFTIATECALQKAAWYTIILRDCICSLKELLLEDYLWDVFVNIEMKLLPIIADMEHRGVLVDMEQLRAMEALITARMKEVEAACHRAAGRTFQITSATQVRALLYDELQLDSRRNVKIRETVTKGAKSTSEAMLKSLMAVHPLPRLILEHRHLHKAHATFLTGIAQHVKDGVVKPSWDQTAAATGRIASNNPNLQAIPKAPFSLVLFPGPEDEELQQQQLRFRSVYIARDGCTLLAADFQHVECRVFAHAAADELLLDALRSHRDLFRVLAAKWLSKPEEEVSAADRERTKRIVYASLYGAGARKLMDILDVSYEKALSVAASFNKTFPSLKGFGREVVARCVSAGGRLATLGGRVRRFPDIASADFALRSHAERQAVNFVVQGSAADLCKLAMAATEAALRAAGTHARLLLQIHDELVWEVPDEELHTAAGAARAAMEACGARGGLALPLPVALSAGRSWGHMRHYALH